MSASEDELLQQALHGNQDALARLLAAYGPALRQQWFGKIPKRWQSVLSVDDVLQQTYTDAFLHIHKFEPQGECAFFLWLNAIAKRNLQDVIRALGAEKRGGKQPAAPVDSWHTLFEQIAGSGTTPSRQAVRQEIREILQRSIERLPEPHRQVVELYDLAGRPVEEVAAVMERSPGAVYMLRARAHHWLRELLGGASQFFSDSA